MVSFWTSAIIQKRLLKFFLLISFLGEIGIGAFGSVNKMVFKKTGCVMAVKRIRSTVDEREQKSLLMDLEVVMKSKGCPFIVTFFGAIFKVSFSFN